MVSDPGLDLAHPSFHGRFERRRERHRPQPEDRMNSLLRPGDEQPGLGIANGSAEARDDVGGEEGRVGGHGDDEAAAGPIGPRPFDPGVDSGERPRLAFEAIFDHRQVKRRKPRHISIGVDDEVRDLRPQTIDDASEHWLAPERQQAFVATAHAARSAAGEKNADDIFRQVHARNLGL